MQTEAPKSSWRVVGGADGKAAPPPLPPEGPHPDVDRLRPARGLMIGLLVAAGVWLAIAAIVLLAWRLRF